MGACACGHSFEEHGNDPDYPGSTGCNYEMGGDACGCISYEEDDWNDDEDSE